VALASRSLHRIVAQRRLDFLAERSRDALISVRGV
jgi:hypothetical protein